jgi:hypothetical protein
VLTILQIKSAKPAERAYKLADTGGLFVLVQPNGSKLWRYKFRLDGVEGLQALRAFPLKAQMVLHRLWRRHRGTTPHPLRQHAPRMRQHLLGTRRTVLAIDIAHQQRTSSASTATTEEEEDSDMANSGLCRAGLPETGAPRRSAVVRVRRRPQAASARPASAQTLTARTTW